MLPHIAILSVLGAGTAATAVGTVWNQSRRDAWLWHEAGRELGLEFVEGGLTENRRLQGRFEGVEVRVQRRGLDPDHNRGVSSKTCSVMGRIRLPLPPGVHVRRMTPAERTMPNLMGTGRRRLTTISDVRVMANDTPEAQRLFEKPEVRAALVDLFSGRDGAQLFGDRLSFVETYLASVDLQAAVESTVEAVRVLERALGWDPRPEGEGPRRVEARPLVAFNVEPPPPVRHRSDQGPPRAGREVSPAGGLMGRLVEELGAEATEVEAGTFTLDREAALRKLSKRRLEDPAAFVHDLLRAIVLGEATRVEIRHDADELWVRFDGESFSQRELEAVYGTAFASSPDRRVQACRHLALAIEGAMGLGPLEVAVRGPAGRLRRTDDGEVVDGGVDLGVDLDAGALGNEFYVRLPRRLRRGRLTPVTAMARSRAPVMDIEVQIDGEVLPPLGSAQGQWGYTPFRARGRHGAEHPIRGWVAFDLRAHSDFGEAYIGRHGVWVEHRRLPHAPRRLRAVVMYGELATDLSGTKLIVDDELKRALGAANRALGVAIVRAVEQLHTRRKRGRTVPAHVEGWMRGMCMRALGRPTVRRLLAGELDEAREHLLDASVWPTVLDRRTSLRKLAREARRARTLPFVDTSLSQLVGPEQAALLADDVSATIPGYAVNVSALSHDEREFLRGIFNETLTSQTTRLLDLVAELTAPAPDASGSADHRVED